MTKKKSKKKDNDQKVTQINPQLANREKFLSLVQKATAETGWTLAATARLVRNKESGRFDIAADLVATPVKNE